MDPLSHDHGDWIAVAGPFARYGRALDDKDWGSLRTCFLPDTRFVYADSGTYESYDSFEELARTTLGRCSTTQHLVGTVNITTVGDTGEARSYVQPTTVSCVSPVRATTTPFDGPLRAGEEPPAGWFGSGEKDHRVATVTKPPHFR